MWATYNAHQTVNHQLHFVDPNMGAHKQFRSHVDAKQEAMHGPTTLWYLITWQSLWSQRFSRNHSYFSFWTQVATTMLYRHGIILYTFSYIYYQIIAISQFVAPCCHMASTWFVVDSLVFITILIKIIICHTHIRPYSCS